MLDSTFQAYLANIDLSLWKISRHLERNANRLDSWNSDSHSASTIQGDIWWQRKKVFIIFDYDNDSDIKCRLVAEAKKWQLAFWN